MSFQIKYGSIQPFNSVENKKRGNTNINRTQSSFQEILNRQVQKSQKDIKISSHANKRLSERNITLDENDLKTLRKAMDRADQKGARESLMLYKDIAFIASIKNHTLITAMDPKDSKENIFTNIDSAIIVK